MSYCRYQNTLRDLRDCLKALREDGLLDLSEEEARAAAALADVCNYFSEEYSIFER